MRLSRVLSRRDETMGNDVQKSIREGFRAAITNEYDIRQRLAYGARQIPLLESICYPESIISEPRPIWPWEIGR
jgi:hypothetical protein